MAALRRQIPYESPTSLIFFILMQYLGNIGQIIG